jgi:hypothetical protein
VVWAKNSRRTMSMNNETLLIQRCQSLIRRSRHKSESTRSFNDFPDSVKKTVSSLANMRDSETPIVCFYPDHLNWTLLTTERLVWCDGSTCRNLSWNDISYFDADDIEMTTEPRKVDGPSRIIVTSRKDIRHKFGVDSR